LPKFYQNRAAAYENLVNDKNIIFSFKINLLFSYKFKKLYQNVIEDCTSALQVDPSYTKALARRAKAYESIDKLQEAFEDHTALCILQKFTGSSMASADRIVKKVIY
jgi:import receptor subunit TOM70